MDTRQSEFNTPIYRNVSKSLNNNLKSKSADYLLHDSLGAPLAIIEAKHTSKDPLIRQKQAEQYANDIKAQTGRNVFIFLSNDNEIWFWNNEYCPLRRVQGFYARKDLESLRFQNSQIDDSLQIKADDYFLDDKRTPLDRKGDIPAIIENFRKRREEDPSDRKGKCFYVPSKRSEMRTMASLYRSTRRLSVKRWSMDRLRSLSGRSSQ